MVTIIFESHATTIDNEQHVASGHFDIELSNLGIKQAKELGERYRVNHLDAIFCSNLQRSYKTAEIAFGKRSPIVKDARLRECDYGNFTRKSSAVVDPEKIRHITRSFPKGESYEQCAKRMKSFLQDLLKKYNEKTVMIIGHRATQYGLEHLIKGISLTEAVTKPWKWQPGWTYKLNGSL